MSSLCTCNSPGRCIPGCPDEMDEEPYLAAEPLCRVGEDGELVWRDDEMTTNKEESNGRDQ